MKLTSFKSWLYESDDSDGDNDNDRQDHMAWDQGDTQHQPQSSYEPNISEDASSKVRDIHSPVLHHGDVHNDSKGDNSGSVLSHKDNLSMSSHDLTFTEEHRKTLRFYKDMSPHFNTPLRTGTYYEPDDKEESRIYPNEHKHYIQHMDHITNHAMPSDHVTFRGATKRYDFNTLKPGDHIIDHGYTGTTHDPATAHDFSSKMTMPNGEEKHKLFRIHMPAGTKAYHLDRHENDHDQEQETLLHRGTKFLVGNHHSYDSHHVVDLHVVSQGHELGKDK